MTSSLAARIGDTNVRADGSPSKIFIPTPRQARGELRRGTDYAAAAAVPVATWKLGYTATPSAALAVPSSRASDRASANTAISSCSSVGSLVVMFCIHRPGRVSNCTHFGQEGL